jgi:hypothetical protein
MGRAIPLWAAASGDPKNEKPAVTNSGLIHSLQRVLVVTVVSTVGIGFQRVWIIALASQDIGRGYGFFGIGLDLNKGTVGFVWTGQRCIEKHPFSKGFVKGFFILIGYLTGH